MSLLNNNFITFEGDFNSVRALTGLSVLGPHADKMNGQLFGWVRAAYYRFATSVLLSPAKDGYLTHDVTFDDGSKARFISNNGNHTAMVWPSADSGGARYDIYPTYLRNSFADPKGDYCEWANPPMKLGGSFNERVFESDAENPKKKLFNPENLDFGFPGNMDWSDRRQDGEHFGRVLSWWDKRGTRYSGFTGTYSGGAEGFSADTWPIAYAFSDSEERGGDALRTVWCNGNAIAIVPVGYQIHQACLITTEGDEGKGYGLRIICKNTSTESVTCFQTSLSGIAVKGGGGSKSKVTKALPLKITQHESAEEKLMIAEAQIIWELSPAAEHVLGSLIERLNANSSGTRAVYPSRQGLIEIDLSNGQIVETLLSREFLLRTEHVAESKTVEVTSDSFSDITLGSWGVQVDGETGSTIIKRSVIGWDYVGDTPCYLYSESVVTYSDSSAGSASLTAIELDTDPVTDTFVDYLGNTVSQTIFSSGTGTLIDEASSLYTQVTTTAQFFVKDSNRVIVYSENYTSTSSQVYDFLHKETVDSLVTDPMWFETGNGVTNLTIMGDPTTYRSPTFAFSEVTEDRTYEHVETVTSSPATHTEVTDSYLFGDLRVGCFDLCTHSLMTQSQGMILRNSYSVHSGGTVSRTQGYLDQGPNSSYPDHRNFYAWIEEVTSEYMDKTYLRHYQFAGSDVQTRTSRVSRFINGTIVETFAGADSRVDSTDTELVFNTPFGEFYDQTPPDPSEPHLSSLLKDTYDKVGDPGKTFFGFTPGGADGKTAPLIRGFTGIPGGEAQSSTTTTAQYVTYSGAFHGGCASGGYTSSFDNELIFRNLAYRTLPVDTQLEPDAAEYVRYADVVGISSGDSIVFEDGSVAGMLLLGPVEDPKGRFVDVPKTYLKKETIE